MDYLWFSSRWDGYGVPRWVFSAQRRKHDQFNSPLNKFHEVIAKIMLFLNQSSRLSLAPVISKDLYIHDLFFILHLHNRDVPRCKNLWCLLVVSIDWAGLWLLFSGLCFTSFITLIGSWAYIRHLLKVSEVGDRNCYIQICILTALFTNGLQMYQNEKRICRACGACGRRFIALYKCRFVTRYCYRHRFCASSSPAVLQLWRT